MPVHDLKCRHCSDITTKYIDTSKKKYLQCDRCDSYDVFIYYGNFKADVICGTQYYTSAATGKVGLTSSEIDQKCKNEGLVYGTTNEIERESKKYKYQKESARKKRSRKVAEDIYQTFKDKGCYS